MIDKELIKKIEEEIENISNACELNEFRVEYLGKKGIITLLSGKMKELSNEEKKEYGKELNQLKTNVTTKLEAIASKIREEELKKKLEEERLDVTLPGTYIPTASFHPLNRVIEEVKEIFISMGYDVESGPEIENDLYNFELLNIPKSHPARDMQDTFYITDEVLLRSQTSPVQIRTMLKNKEKTPIRIICPGKVYRRDNDDATHSHEFHQIEGLVVDENISMSDLKGTLEIAITKLFGSKRKLRFRPSFFPFTEPSVEIDVSCFKCDGKGCNICKKTGWIEVLGGGMVHPNVLKNCGYDPDKYTGFAFGIGVERIAMLKYEVRDIRDFYTNDIRFLSQFNAIEKGEDNVSK